MAVTWFRCEECGHDGMGFGEAAQHACTEAEVLSECGRRLAEAALEWAAERQEAAPRGWDHV